MLGLDFFRHFLLSRRAGALIRTIAWLAMVGIALGVFSLVVVTSVMNGFHESIRRRLLAAEPHMVFEISEPGADQSGPTLESITAAARSKANDPTAEFHLIERQDIVVRTAEGVFSGAEARGLDDAATAHLLKAVEAAANEEKPGSSDIATASESDMAMAPGEVIMGSDFARGLGIFEGDKITVIAPEGLLLPPGEAPRFERVTVKRLLTTNVADVDGRLFLYARGQSLRGLGASASKRSEVEAWLSHPGTADDVAGQLRRENATWKIQTWGDRNSVLFMALRLELFSIGLFLSLSTMIAGFSIVTVLLILITQKRKEIGLLMGIGLSRAKTRRLFTSLGLALSGAGIVVGGVAGVFVSLLIDSTKTSILPEFYYDTTIPAKLNPVFVSGVFLLALGLSFLASYIPARRIAKLEPADALMSRYRNREAPL